jgi:hypothetical protein
VKSTSAWVQPDRSARAPWNAHRGRSASYVARPKQPEIPGYGEVEVAHGGRFCSFRDAECRQSTRRSSEGS